MKSKNTIPNRLLFIAMLLLIVPVKLVFPQSLTPDVSFAKATICSYIDENIRYGDTDKTTEGAVTKLQDYLYAAGYYPHAGIGEFGKATLNAVIQFQKDNDLPSTGFFGPMSRTVVKSLACVEEIQPVAIIATSTPVVLGTTTINSTATTTAEISSTTDKVTTMKLQLPYNRVSNFDGWKSTWGSATSTVDGQFLLKATASTTGAEAVLTGSEDWTDYLYTIDFTANRNGSLALLGRFVDDTNFLACNFSEGNVWIQQRLDGQSTNLAVGHVDLPPVNSVLLSTHVNMKVVGNQVSCSITGMDDVKATVTEPRFQKGGIGLSIWHSVVGVSSLLIREVDVKKL